MAGKIYNPDYEGAVRASFARQGLMVTLGARLADVSPGKIIIEVPHTHGVTQQQGYFHGGVAGAVADTAGGYAAMTLMPARSEVLTVEYKINFIRPAVAPLLRASAEIVRAGKTLLIARIDVLCGAPDQPEACAIAQATYMRVETTV